ncbi:hypothetical protein Tco_1137734 [Tanacetum coccineum]
MPIRNVTFVQPLNDVTKPTKLNPNGNTGGLNSMEPECTTGLNMSNASQVGSFAEVLKHKVAKQVVKVKELRNSKNVDGAAVIIPLKAVEEVSSRFVNTLYRYFIGDRLVFPLVENYVKNTWAKYGFKHSFAEPQVHLESNHLIPESLTMISDIDVAWYDECLDWICYEMAYGCLLSHHYIVFYQSGSHNSVVSCFLDGPAD